MEKWCAFQRMKAFLYGYLKGKQQRLMILRVFLRELSVIVICTVDFVSFC